MYGCAYGIEHLAGMGRVEAIFGDAGDRVLKTSEIRDQRGVEALLRTRKAANV